METDDVDERFPGAGEEQETVSGNDMTARPYQVELLERAKERNIIVCLGTGTGKTFISVMLIKELAHEVRKSYENGGKRTFFLVNTVPLASQQASVIDRHTDLRVQHYVGEMGVDFWKKGQWEKEFNEHNVLVMTAQIFLDLLHHGYVGLSQVNLLIFDECHHAKKKDPYKQIMHFFDVCPREEYPRVMGLTASIVNGKVKPWKLEAEIWELEQVLRSTCETTQDGAVEMFAAKPREELVTFNKDCLSEDNAILIQILGDVLKPGQDFLRDCRVERQNETVKNAYAFAKFTLRECLETLETLGPWAANRVAEYMIKDLERARTFQDDKEGLLFCELCATTLRQLQGVYRNFANNGSGGYSGGEQYYIMPKLEKLFSILKDYRTTQAEEGKQLCGIVFVERRYAALVLSEAINIIAAQDHELNFIKSKFVTGHSTGRVNYSNQTDMNFKKQEEVLRQFRKHEFNLLVATSVVEEGLDIPKCNVVCRFDFPNNFRSYVQSKGRARAKNSRYIVLVEQQEKTEKEGDLELLREIEKFLQTLCHDRTLPSEEESIEAVDTDYLPPYMPRKGEGQARVTMSSGISLLSRYCSKLPGDRFTRLKPVYKVEEVGKEAYKCILQMPNNCPLRDNILGPPMPQKRLAKMAVALLTCEQLHKMGELDDNLFPVRTLSDEESEGEEDEEERGGKKAGTKKRRRLYERKVPDAFTGSLPQHRQPLYLTVITITITNITNSRELDVSEQMFVDGSCRVFGLLTKCPLPPVRPFKLFPNYGEITVSLEPQLQVNSVRDLDTCQRFHCLLFSHVLRVRVEADPESLDGYFVVLLNPSCEVDTGRMKKLLTLAETASDDSVIEKDAVVTKKYAESRKHKERFAVVGVRRDLCSSSPFPERSKASTFDAYFNQEYGVNIKNKKQPLLEVKHLSGRVNFLVDRSKVKSKGGVIQLPQELCDSIGFPASLLSVCVTLPSILHRVNSLLLVTDLRRTIAGAHAQYSDDELECELPPIGVDDSSNTMEEESMDEAEEEFPGLCSQLEALFPNNRSADVGPPLPDSALLLQALTTTHATDAFNLERLEMLGDSFLKLAVSLYLFCNYKDKDEGKLTERKVRQISNLALFRAAKKKSLGGYLQSTQLARDVWCPLGCRVSEGSSDRRGVAMELDEETDDITMATNDDAHETRASVSRDASCSSHHQDTGEETVLSAVEHAQQKCTTQRIADKSVADSIEGLIGAYLISCGYTGALHFMKFLGLKVLPEDDNDDDDDLVGSAVDGQPGKYASLCFNPTNAFLGMDRNEIPVSHMMSGLESFEKSINYTFQYDKLYLLEALTHASYHANRVTVCYQRLEFLGDALLDFLVTQHLYFRHANLSPGQLTDVRQALVNNNIFAIIAVKYKYHKYLKQMSPQWFKKIENFINRVEDETPDGKVSADSFIIVSEEDEEGIEAPKVLGDIFESVAGAVFLDSGMDLTKIWRVYYRMMKPYIDHYSCNVPINPIRGVYENDAEAEFGKAETLPDGRIKRTVRVHWGEFVGKGANGRIAKLTAAKLAIKALNRAQQTTPTSSM